MYELEFSMVKPDGQIITYALDRAKYKIESEIITSIESISKELVAFFEHLYAAKVNPYYLNLIVQLQTTLGNYRNQLVEQIWTKEFQALTKISEFQLN